MTGLAVLEQASALLAALTPVALSDAEVLAGLPLTQMLCQAAEAMKVALVREAEIRKLPLAQGAAHPLPWTADVLKVSRATAGRLRRLGRSLTGTPLLAQAFSAGRITNEQAQLMANALAGLPSGSESLVLARGADLAPDQLRVVLRELQEELDPIGTQQRDEDAAARAESRDWPRRRITLSRLPDSNLVRIHGYLDVTAAGPFLSALDALCSPRNRTALGLPENPTANASGGCSSDCSAGGCSAGGGGVGGHGSASAAAASASGESAYGAGGGADEVGSRGAGPGSGGSGSAESGWSPLGEADLRTAAQRRHDAVCEIGHRIHAMGTLPDHGGDRPQVVVTVGLQTLIDGLSGLGYLDDGTPLTPAACRLMACDALVIPAVLNGESLPLDLGRSQRHFNVAIRRALRIRDGGCTFPACDRKAPWTEAHHCLEWSRGGPSDLWHATLVCRYHHRFLHHSDWTVRISPTDGLPEYFAPGDPTPRRNHYHRRP